MPEEQEKKSPNYTAREAVERSELLSRQMDLLNQAILSLRGEFAKAEGRETKMNDKLDILSEFHASTKGARSLAVWVGGFAVAFTLTYLGWVWNLQSQQTTVLAGIDKRVSLTEEKAIALKEVDSKFEEASEKNTSKVVGALEKGFEKANLAIGKVEAEVGKLNTRLNQTDAVIARLDKSVDKIQSSSSLTVASMKNVEAAVTLPPELLIEGALLVLKPEVDGTRQKFRLVIEGVSCFQSEAYDVSLPLGSNDLREVLTAISSDFAGTSFFQSLPLSRGGPDVPLFLDAEYRIPLSRCSSCQSVLGQASCQS